MSTRQPDEEAIFHIARRITDHLLRSDYLEQICGDNTALLTRLQALLEVHEKEHDFLRSGKSEPTATLDAESISEAPGTDIGRYRLMEQIGEGGMGVVFVAEQRQPLKRKVALKVIKPGMDSRAVIARFEAERQALALMDHPNIARVLDAGSTSAGRPYFVMEYVRGIPITEYCDNNKLTIRERLDLFVQVCQAIQHAHQKGIVHRDIKPSNVLVTLHDGKPVPKVIDFGVAKALNTRLTDRTIYTAHMQIIGTMMYMSPEQAELSGLDVDTRSDVYSLGVLLYELLTGTTPFKKDELERAGLDEQRRIIRESEPPRASVRISSLGDTATTIAEHRKTDARRLRQLVRGDLDWIVMKALEKDRTRRYETASSFAADVGRYLDNEAIEARPPSTVYRIRKVVSRHRTLALGSLLVVGALLFGLVNTSISKRQVEEANRRLIATLATLRDEYLDRAFGDAFAGDVRACEESLNLADQAGADAGLIEFIRALALLFGGQLSEAIAILETAAAKEPDNLALLSAALWASIYDGDIQKATDLAERVFQARSTGRESQNDYERLLVIYNRVYTEDPTDVIAELDDIISRHPRWGIAYAIRAEAKTQLARLTRDMSDVNDARDDAALSRRYHPDNAFVLSSSMYVFISAIELARHHKLSDVDVGILEDLAREIASQMESSLDYRWGRAYRLVFYHLTNREEEYRREYKALSHQRFGGDQAQVARLLQDGDVSLLHAYLHNNQRSFAAKTAIAVCNVMNGDRASARPALNELKREYTNLNQRWLMLDVALIAQDPNLVRLLAQEFVKPSADGRIKALTRADVLMARFYAGEIGEEELLEMCGPFLVDRSIGHYAIGMWRLAVADSDGDAKVARQHLEIAADCPMPGLWHVEFAKAYVHLLDTGRLPVR